MITWAEIRKAMRMLEDPEAWYNASKIHLDVALQLETCKGRDQYSGTFDSAVECLLETGFQIQDGAE